jgi:hypothetical protein
MTTYTVTATATNATTDTITVSSVTNMFSGMPIVFSGTTFGGITAGATYYIGTVVPGYPTSTITVTSLPGGAVVGLTTATGVMTGTFSSGGQQIINIGTLPNDGTGDPLRTAFNDTNLNFDQVFAAGPVGSNIRIANNTILTTNTNGNLVLAPNGTGMVKSNVNIVPDQTHVRNLGAPTLRWDTIYSYNYSGNGSGLTGIVASANIGTASKLINEFSEVNIPDPSGSIYANVNSVNITVTTPDGFLVDGNVTVNGTIALPNTPSGAANTIQYGLGNLIGYLDGQWTIGEYDGTNYGQQGIRINPGIEGAADIYLPSDLLANVDSLSVSNYIGNVEIRTGNSHQWKFGDDGSFAPPVQPSNQRTGSGLVLKLGDTDQQAIITGPAPVANVYNTAPRLVVAGQDGVLNGEGGDIYLWAGRSGPNAGGQGGGDIKIDAGEAINGAEGGTIKIRGGYSGAGAGGFVEIYAGDGNIGAEVDIRSGQGNSAANSANITLSTPYGGTWRFGNDGNLTLPTNTSSINYANGNPYGGTGGGNANKIANGNSYANIATANGNLVVNVGTDGYGTWTFETGTGNLIGPGNISQGAGIVFSADQSVYIREDQGQLNIDAGSHTVITSNSGNVGNTQSWDFGSTGNLTLPANTFAVNYANGDPVIISGGTANTGNVTFSGEIVIGTGTSNLISGLYLAPSSSSANADMYLRVRGNITDEPTHIHFDTGNNQYYNQFIGDDNKYIQLANTGNIVINSNDAAGNSAQWTFDYDGYLTLPADATISDFSDTASLNVDGSGRVAQLYWNGNIGNGNPDNGSDYYTWAYVASGGFFIQHENVATSTDNLWGFGIDGNITLPTGTPSINYANGSPYGGGGGNANTGNVTFDNQAVVGTGDGSSGVGGLYLAPGTASTANLQYLRVRGGDVATHIHLDTGNNIYFDQYFGNDGKFVKLEATGNVQIGSNDTVGNSAQWTFDTTGNLTVPGGGAVFSIGTGTIGVTANNTSGNAYLGLDDTGSAATLYGNAGVQIGTNGNVGWNFQPSGNLTFPNGAVFTGYDLYAAANSYVELAGYTGNTYMGVGNDSVFIQTDWNGAQNQWSFFANATMTAPGAISAVGNITGGNVSVTGNVLANNIVAEATFSIQTANFNAVIGGRYGVNTTANTVTATLPSSPATGGAVFFADAGGTYSSNNLIINPNGATIMGASGNMTVSTDNQSVGLFYNGATWRTYNAG